MTTWHILSLQVTRVGSSFAELLWKMAHVQVTIPRKTRYHLLNIVEHTFLTSRPLPLKDLQTEECVPHEVYWSGGWEFHLLLNLDLNIYNSCLLRPNVSSTLYYKPSLHAIPLGFRHRKPMRTSVIWIFNALVAVGHKISMAPWRKATVFSPPWPHHHPTPPAARPAWGPKSIGCQSDAWHKSPRWRPAKYLGKEGWIWMDITKHGWIVVVEPRP